MSKSGDFTRPTMTMTEVIASLLVLSCLPLPLASANTNTNSRNISNQSQDLWNTYCRRGTANVQWCEDVVASHAHDMWIAEYYNTWSNSIFILVAFAGMKRCRSDGLKWSFWVADSIIFLTGIGSFLFHAHQSKLAQVSDELPMVLLLMTSSHSLEGLHPWTTLKNGQRYPSYYLYNHSFVLLYWALYCLLDNYEIFLNGFAFQVAVLLYLGLDSGRKAKHSLLKWICSFSAFAIGQGCWQLERFLYKTDSCNVPGMILLHPLWHVGAGISHLVMVSYYADLRERIFGKSSNKPCSKQLKTD